MRLVRRWLAVVFVLALLVAACSSDAGDAAPASSTGAPADDSDDVADANGSSSVDDETGDSGGTTVGDTPDREAPQYDDTPLPVSDEVRSGTLDNGLTYYVQSNDSPGSSVSMRLAVKAGGWHEDPVGTGVAHFLEHMMFNGTEDYPGNQVDAVLRGIGAEIGPDFNAYTSTTETVYQIAVEDRAENVETAMNVLAQWASAATLDPAEVAAEALVVREELRARDQSGGGLIGTAFEEAYFADTPFEGVIVIGTEASINATTSDSLRAYYDTWYRPDNMAVVAVGDRSLDDLEALIVDAFGDFDARGQGTPSDVPDVELRTEPIVDVVVEPSFGDSYISVDIPFGPWDQSTRGGVQGLVTEILHGIMIDARISEGVDSGRLDLRRGEGGWFPYTRGLQYMGFNVDADDLEAGTEVLMTEIQNTIDNGFSQSELDRAIDLWRNIQQQRRASAGTVQDDDLADGLVEHFLGGADLQSIDDSVELHLDILDSLDLATVNAHYGWAMTGAAPIVLIVGPDEATVGDPANHLAALERARAAGGDAFIDDVIEIEALMDRPAAVKEIASDGLEQNPGIALEFANGMQVVFRPSSISENQVRIVTESPGGRVLLDADDGALAPVAVSAVDASGVGPHSAVQIRRFLSDTDVAFGSYVADYAEGFTGSAAAEDLEVFFQLLHLATTTPAVEDVPLGQQIEFARDAIVEATLDSSAAADIALADALGGGGPVAALPTDDQLDGLSPERALAIYRDRFDALDDHVVVIVGDVDESTVIDLARRYVGSLPAPSDDPDAEPEPLPGVQTIRTSAGSGVSAGAYRLTTVGVADETVRNRVLAELANSLLNDRLFTVVREQLGATYGGSAFVSFREPGDGVELTIAIDGDPGRIDEISDTVLGELDALAAGSLTPTDFDEAVAVLQSRYNFVNNGFYIESLFDEAQQSDASRVISRTAQVRELDRLDRGDLTAFIAALAPESDRVEVLNVPAN